MVVVAMPMQATHVKVKEDVNISRQGTLTKEYEAVVHTFELPQHAADERQVIVIDAGHGGHDPGCIGAQSQEKHIALDIALALGASLSSSYPDLEVLYTRKTDIFVPLHKRINMANREKADVFISIHCNYVGNPHICGSETYVMGLHRAEENLKVAKRENAAVLMEEDFENNYEGYDPNSPVGHILLSAMQNVHLDHSIELAAAVESGLAARAVTESRGVKQAGFVVLRQATMPSILVETGFLSNAKEEKYLLSSKGQTEIASSLQQSIATYLKLTPSASIKHLETSYPTRDTDAVYCIQLGVYSSPSKQAVIEQIKKLGKPTITQIGEVYRYTMGRYSSKAAASDALQLVREAGFADAYVRQR